MTFKDFALNPVILNSLQKIGYEIPTPIQAQAIPVLLKKKDLLAIAQTGTGKTAAFCLPIVNNLMQERVSASPKHPKALILTPTRELAVQIHENLEEYGQNLNQRYAVIFGGVSQGSQVRDMQIGPHVLVATPGRLLDLIEQGYIKLSQVETFVLDEADRMLDMGFLSAIKDVLRLLPKKRHSLFFSATMPKEIEVLANEILFQPQKIEVTPESTTVERIKQTVMYVDKPRKTDLLVHLLKDASFEKTIVFVEMKHVANRITETLIKNGISAAAIHGNKSQGARQRALQDFKDGRARVLVATDIASRGIDVDGITHVVNFELSNITESYVHRVGRTARAGKEGQAVSLITADEKSYLVDVERSTKQKIPVVKDHPYHSDEAENAAVMSVGKAKSKIEAERKAGLRASRPKSSRPRSSSQKSSTQKATPQKTSSRMPSSERSSKREDGKDDTRSQSSNKPKWSVQGESSKKSRWGANKSTNNKSTAEGGTSGKPNPNQSNFKKKKRPNRKPFGESK